MWLFDPPPRAVGSRLAGVLTRKLTRAQARREPRSPKETKWVGGSLPRRPLRPRRVRLGFGRRQPRRRCLPTTCRVGSRRSPRWRSRRTRTRMTTRRKDLRKRHPTASRRATRARDAAFDHASSSSRAPAKVGWSRRRKPRRSAASPRPEEAIISSTSTQNRSGVNSAAISRGDSLRGGNAYTQSDRLVRHASFKDMSPLLAAASSDRGPSRSRGMSRSTSSANLSPKSEP